MKARLSCLILRAVGCEYAGNPVKIKLEEPDKWNGRNPAKFDEWLQDLLRYIDLTGLSGPTRDSQRVRLLGVCLEGEALSWYNAVVDPIYSFGQVRMRDWTFAEAVWALYNHFVHDVMLNNASQDFQHVAWKESTGVSGFYFNLVKHASRMLPPPTDSVMVERIMNQIPADMREWLIDDEDVVPELISACKLVQLCRQYERKQKVLKHYQERAGEERKHLGNPSENHQRSSCQTETESHPKARHRDHCDSHHNENDTGYRNDDHRPRQREDKPSAKDGTFT